MLASEPLQVDRLGGTELNQQKNKANDDAFRLDGQTAVVTGASSGIGRAIAIELARAGANVVVSGHRNLSGLRETHDQIVAVGSQCRELHCDLSSPDVERLVDDAWDAFGHVDAWLNIAGADVLTGSDGKLPFEAKLERLWNVDVAGTIRISRLVGQRMRQQGSGSIVNMGWDQAHIGQAGDSGELFAATKGAVMAFTLSLARSLGPAVRVNCLAPGWIKTKWGEDAPEFWDQRARGESLLERWGTPEDVAWAARYLVSPAGAFINGQIVPVNGGAQPWPSRLTRREGDS
ncbi:MAG: SDR family oxidoreductase [Planctomycetota bacterium]